VAQVEILPRGSSRDSSQWLKSRFFLVAQVEILHSGSTLCETRLLNKKTTLKGHPSPHTFMAMIRMKHYQRRRRTFHDVSHIVDTADKHSFENISAKFREKESKRPDGILGGPVDTDSRKKFNLKIIKGRCSIPPHLFNPKK
jgi:hypothetical protein